MSRKSVQFCSLRLSTAKKCTSGPFPSSRSQEGQVCLFDITKRKRMSFNSWTTGFYTTDNQEVSRIFNCNQLPATTCYFLDGLLAKVPVIPARLPDFHDSLLFLLLNWFTLRQNLRNRIQNNPKWVKIFITCQLL